MKLELGNYEMDMISHEPLVYTLKGVLTELECQHFINTSSDKMKRSSVSGYAVSYTHLTLPTSDLV